MKFHEVVEQFIDAKYEYENPDYIPDKDFRLKQEAIKKERYEETAKELDNAYDLLLQQP